jgi:hypothetical protein
MLPGGAGLGPAIHALLYRRFVVVRNKSGHDGMGETSNAIR